MIAIFVSEFAPRSSPAIRLALDVINGLPTIVIGIFVFSVLVLGHRQSGFAGATGARDHELPLVARAAQEVLALVPSILREGALALGAAAGATVLGVVLPTSLGGILTGTMLAVARAAGETAPLLFTSRRSRDAVATDPRHAAAEHAAADLHLLGVSRTRRPRAGLGDRARPDRLRPRRRA